MSTQPQAEQQADHLGMTEEQWTQWQVYTHGFGEQDENGVDLSLLRQNLRLTPTERLRKHQKALRMYMGVHDAGVTARLPEHPCRS